MPDRLRLGRASAAVARLSPPQRWVAGAGVVFFAWLILDNVLDRGIPPGIVLLGAVYGSLYGALALGIVLIYRANRVINFAQAELGSVAAVLAIELVLQLEVNYFLAIAVAFASAIVMGAGINVLVIRRFRDAPRLIVAVATIGLAQVLNGFAILIPIWWSGMSTGTFSSPFATRFEVYPVVFNGNHVVAIVAVGLAMAGLAAFLRFTDYGVAIRAAADNGERARLLGIPVPRLSTITWALAALLSALAVILRVPVMGFASFSSVSGSGTSLLLLTLAAAVLARMDSMPRAVVAGIGLGIVQTSATWIWPNTTIVDALIVGLILVALLAQRHAFERAAETGISTWRAMREVRPVPEELRTVRQVRYAFTGLKLAVLAFALAVPLWASHSQAEAAALILIYSIVAVSLLVLTGWAGQISLGQFAFVGFGAAVTGVLYGRHGWDFLAALPVGVAVAGAAALVVGLPALRIRGPFLAVTTLGFAVTASTFFLEERYLPWFVTEDYIARPVLLRRFSLDEGWQMYLFALVGLLAAFQVARNLRRSRTGRALIATRDNELAGQAVSLDTTRMKLTAFVISGALAGFAGAVYMVSQHGVKPGAFGAEVSLRLFSMVVIGGLGSLGGAVLGAGYVRGAELFLPAGWELLASGFGILLLLMFVPEGLGGIVYAVRDAFLRRVARRHGIDVPSLVADRRGPASEPEPVTFSIASAPAGARPADGTRTGNGASPAFSRKKTGRETEKLREKRKAKA